MVQYVDGSVLAQLGNPDMRTPIAYALAWPERIDSGVASLDLFAIAKLDFVAPDFERFPCLALAYQALRAGGTVPALLNAANEVAVDAFLNLRIAFLDIPRLIESVMADVSRTEVHQLQDVLDADAAARVSAQAWVEQNTK
jgi:1-deoxy-D-xylulose-5-phosphate reductoisomerase